MSTTINVQLSHITGLSLSLGRDTVHRSDPLSSVTLIFTLSCHTVSHLHHAAYSSEVIHIMTNLQGGNVFCHDIGDTSKVLHKDFSLHD